MPSHILVIDDDPVQRRLLAGMIEQLGHVAHHAENGRTGLSILEELGERIDVVLLDLLMPEMSGQAFLEEIGRRGLDVPVIVQTGQGGIETVVHAMQAGAFDFVMKPVTPERLTVALHQAMKVERRHDDATRMAEPASDDIGFESIVSASPAMIRALDLARRAAASDIPVLIEGESGVGKKRLARAIHQEGRRAGGPFVVVDCAALAPALAEAILFGRERGIGAAVRLAGKFRDADGGTLLLNDVASLPTTVQAKLLHAVQFGEIEPVNARNPVKVDLRLMVSSGRDLITEVREGRFREDLYYRLSVFPIAIPALARRREDVPALVRHIVRRLAVAQGHEGVGQGIDAGAMALLTAYDWPGNIRELENLLYRALILAEGRELTVRDFPDVAARTGPIGLRSVAAEGMSARLAGTTAPQEQAASGKLSILGVSEAGRNDAHSGREDGTIAGLDATGEVRKLADVEEDLIRFALKFYRGQMSQVARKLGIGRSTLYRKLKDYGIDPDNPLSSAA
ncbi:sigma-54-dependent Fis family transcriptional regulator [Xaviernesmea oryzae]|uniref:DNA-binding transcriptional regulator NtrC n=1 Tax=Xaviernesmea oryzae TaxID=464029 RepID=A0A1Q9AZD6_9HYPH|nr:sigma-54 dependent transcriptional regulator [Xaviernesmea oryzae]OLP61067.1 sigma-54-dependent Fis family transcriptional regulator [Xaviernesmea oryzae]SEL14745.1 DNA-binding transcriptional response regulator, NtrC family, contains REC, AAA-type ATPase, and a Fis-type DNA-binding domains [Xaviernesmea oryzae]